MQFFCEVRGLQGRRIKGKEIEFFGIKEGSKWGKGAGNQKGSSGIQGTVKREYGYFTRHGRKNPPVETAGSG